MTVDEANEALASKGFGQVDYTKMLNNNCIYMNGAYSLAEMRQIVAIMEAVEEARSDGNVSQRNT